MERLLNILEFEVAERLLLGAQLRKNEVINVEKCVFCVNVTLENTNSLISKLWDKFTVHIDKSYRLHLWSTGLFCIAYRAISRCSKYRISGQRQQHRKHDYAICLQYSRR